MDNIKDYDLIIYNNIIYNLYLARVTKVRATNLNTHWVTVQDIKMLQCTNTNHILELVPHTIHSVSIKKNFGNISIEKFIEEYPEWQL